MSSRERVGAGRVVNSVKYCDGRSRIFHRHKARSAPLAAPMTDVKTQATCCRRHAVIKQMGDATQRNIKLFARSHFAAKSIRSCI